MAKRPVKAQPAALDRAMPVSDAFRALMGASLAQLRANERGMLEGRDPEYLHQMRVALRRMRSTLAVFAPLFPEAVVAPVRAELRWAAASLGAARDWDVFATQTLPLAAAEIGPRLAASELAARCEGLRSAAGGQARRAVRSARYRRLLLELATWLAGEAWLARLDLAGRATWHAPVISYSGRVLALRYRRVRERGRHLEGLSAVRLHRLRIAVKKFRYAADFFAVLYKGKAVRAALRRLSKLQDILGAMNDAAAASALVTRAYRGAGPARSAAAQRVFLRWRRHRVGALRRELGDAWREFRAVRKFW